ncbi:MAG: hypothetical protein ACRDN0_14795 [Trebonia sp.]
MRPGARFPAALAALARHHAQACVTGAREGYRIEGKRFAATARAVDLVGRAFMCSPDR